MARKFYLFFNKKNVQVINYLTAQNYMQIITLNVSFTKKSNKSAPCSGVVVK